MKITKPSQLAAKLGVSRQALNHHLRNPTAPPVGDVAAWEKFLTHHGRVETAPEDLRRKIVLKKLEILAQQEIELRRENARKAGELISFDEVQKHYAECLLPIRQRLLALPSEAAARCNPSDPEFARRALLEWSDEALRMIREQLPKAK